MQPPEDRGDDPRVGSTVSGRYFVQRLLGRGGMGTVYEAARLDDGRSVALKLLPLAGDAARLARFEREVAAAARLRHPSCVEVLDSGPDGGDGYFIAMERAPGRDLARVLLEDGPLPAARAARVVDGVLAMLEEAHGAGVIHRDLKPANVMVDVGPDGAEAVKVLDFGVATLLEPGIGEARPTREGITHGTPPYMSPEQIRGEPLDGRSDLYAAGALLFELVAGAPPFDGPTPMAVAARQLTERAPALPGDVPGAVAALVARALERERERRPATAAAMRRELGAAMEGVAGPARAAPRPLPPTEAFSVSELARPPASRRRWLVLGGALVAAGLLAAVRLPAGDAGVMEPPPAGGREAAAPPVPATGPTPPAERERPAPTGPPAPRSVAPTPPRAARPAAEALRRPPIRAVRGELNAVPTPPAATGDGVLVLQASPWAVVSVGGEELGETPREVRIGAGSYAVRAVHPELGVREARVTVGAGERTLWNAAFGD
jgi:serine/threonine-protein kinase